MLREVEQRLGLFEALDAAIPDPRPPERIIHDQKALLAQRITAIALGYEDLNDHQNLRNDPAWQRAAGADPDPETPLAAPSTLCRLENRIDRPTLVQLAAVLVDPFLAAHLEPPEALILDFDVTDAAIHGHQENRFFHGYYDHHCYLPLYVTCGHELLVAYLRPSNIDASRPSRAILKLLVNRLRVVWPHVKITIRADSGFCRWRLRRWCDHNDVGYILGLAKNSVLHELARDELEWAAWRFERTGQEQRLFGSFADAAGTWDRRRRVIVKAEHTARGANPRFLVTNVPGEAQELSEQVSCQRGEAENRIKEQQLDLFANRTSCHRFLANAFRLLLSAAASLLGQALRRTALAGTELAKTQVGTIRLKLLKVAARVTRSVRRVVFHLASSYPYRRVFLQIFGGLSRESPRVADADTG